MATNYNKMIVIQFNEAVNVLNFTQLIEAFRITFQDREHYHGPFVDRNYEAIKVQYMKDSVGTDIKTHLLVLFDEPLNFRKTDTSVTVRYTSSLGGGIYGKLPKDILPDFAQEFIPVNIDQYQNPEQSETVKVIMQYVNTVNKNPIVPHEEIIPAETVKVILLYVNINTPTQIGEIKP